MRSWMLITSSNSLAALAGSFRLGPSLPGIHDCSPVQQISQRPTRFAGRSLFVAGSCLSCHSHVSIHSAVQIARVNRGVDHTLLAEFDCVRQALIAVFPGPKGKKSVPGESAAIERRLDLVTTCVVEQQKSTREGNARTR
jgi:hypothetical protein